MVLSKGKSWIFTLLLISSACGSESRIISEDTLSSFASVTATREYTVRQQLTLVNEGDQPPTKANLWVALIRDFPPYQQVHSRIISTDKYTLVTDEYGNEYAEFDLSDHPPGEEISIEIEYQLSVNEIIYNLGACVGDLPDQFTQPELHIESANPQIFGLAKDLSIGKESVCDQVRAFYDQAGDELIYTFNRNAWGAQATFGRMGSDCTEYASLVIALSRSEGIPARYYEGLLYLKENEKKEGLAQTEHAWLDVYLPQVGWVALDPTLGRASINRETYFAHYTPNHIIITTGRNPSTLRGASYWSFLYWPGNVTSIRVSNAKWEINLLDPK